MDCGSSSSTSSDSSSTSSFTSSDSSSGSEDSSTEETTTTTTPAAATAAPETAAPSQQAPEPQPIAATKPQKSQQQSGTMNTRRRSSELRNAEKLLTPNAKRQATAAGSTTGPQAAGSAPIVTSTTSTRVLRKTTHTSDEDSPPIKKLPNDIAAPPAPAPPAPSTKRKLSTTTPTTKTPTPPLPPTPTTPTPPPKTETHTPSTQDKETTPTPPAKTATPTPPVKTDTPTPSPKEGALEAKDTASTPPPKETAPTPPLKTATPTPPTKTPTPTPPTKTPTPTPTAKTATPTPTPDSSGTPKTTPTNSRPAKLRNQTSKQAADSGSADPKDPKVQPKRTKRQKATSTTPNKPEGRPTRGRKARLAVQKLGAKPKRSLPLRGGAVTTTKSSDEAASSDGLSSSSSDTEGTASTNSFSSQPNKNKKQPKPDTTTGPTRRAKNGPIEVNNLPPNRKFTRSLSTRMPSAALTRPTPGFLTSRLLNNHKKDITTTTETSSEDDHGGRHRTKNGPTSSKKNRHHHHDLSGGGIMFHQGCITPPSTLEKKCPIEGCDSSGHLSGLLDSHFLPDACPIYHNMSASECKEHANERQLLQESEIKVELDVMTNGATSSSSSSFLFPYNRFPVTEEQRAYLAKIIESRASFQPMDVQLNQKVKLEKDCGDDDREPSLVGAVPDYDMQMFREAQGIASQVIENEVKDLPVGKGIKYIIMGKYRMKVWYQSPYPDDAARLPQMYICEFCLRYQTSATSIKRHAMKCIWRHPPGDEIYRKGKLQVWQVDGRRHKQYCQNLCLLAKFFLDHKTLYYDVEPFLFYIMTLADIDGCHTVGYFSKEKNSFYNVSCILTLPPYQRKGYGRLLIDFSYLLTRVEEKIGSPEKPLSDLGLISYRSYWKDVLLDYLCNRTDNNVCIKDVSQATSIYSLDIISTLQALGMMKYWKGKHIVLKKQDVMDEYAERLQRRGSFPKIDETCLRWSPFVQTHIDDFP